MSLPELFKDEVCLCAFYRIMIPRYLDILRPNHRTEPTRWGMLIWNHRNGITTTFCWISLSCLLSQCTIDRDQGRSVFTSSAWFFACLGELHINTSIATFHSDSCRLIFNVSRLYFHITRENILHHHRSSKEAKRMLQERITWFCKKIREITQGIVFILGYHGTQNSPWNAWQIEAPIRPMIGTGRSNHRRVSRKRSNR